MNAHIASQLNSLISKDYQSKLSMFRCQGCCPTYKERSKTPFDFVEVPTDTSFQVLLNRALFLLLPKLLQHQQIKNLV